MKSTWFSKRSHYDFARCLQDADYSLHSWDLLHEWLTAASLSLKQGCRVMVGLDPDPAIEERVIKAQNRVKHPGKLAECLGILVNGLEEETEDFLGSTISELGQNDSKYRGQCFTPYSVCTMMARMTMQDMTPDPNHRLTLQEPACGGGAMVIASSDVLKERGFFPWNYYWTCVDIDWRMFACTYIQCSLLGIPATVIHGNTISLEQWESANTFAATAHPYRVRKEPTKEPEPQPETTHAPIVSEPSIQDFAKHTQLTLF